MELQVVQHRLSEGDSVRLSPGPRVVYDVDDNTARYSTGSVDLHGPAHALAFELVPSASDGTLLSAELQLTDDEDRLMRCDRVDFPPGGVAYLHTHQGPGIRVLLHGSIRIDTAGESHSYGPLQAWFEPGPEPVFAATSETEPSAFVRGMLLPAEWRGRRTIRYVDPADEERPKLQRATVFLEEPIEL
jgi:quercetin dioxygenase-like cupin family protein